MAEKQKSSFLLACTRDWHTLDIARELYRLGRLECLLTTLPLRRTREKGIPDCAVRQCRITQCIAYLLRRLRFNTQANRRALRCISAMFDLETRVYLRHTNASHFLGWAEMCLGSLSIAKQRGLTGLVFEGAPHILEQEKYNRYWKSRYNDASCFADWQIRQRIDEYGLSDAIVVESLYAKNSFGKIYGKAAKEVFILRPGIDGKLLHTPIEQDPEQLRVLMSYPAYRKGGVDLIEAWKKSAICNSLLLLAGPDNQGVRALAAGNPDIHLLGIYQHSADVFPQAQLFVMPTYWDGGPRALMEAAAHGMALISSDRCIGPEIIEEGENGFIVQAGDISSLAERLLWASNNLGCNPHMGIRSRAIAAERRHWPSNVHNF